MNFNPMGMPGGMPGGAPEGMSETEQKIVKYVSRLRTASKASTAHFARFRRREHVLYPLRCLLESADIVIP